METLEAYLDRKEQELNLLNGFLASPLAIRRPVSAAEVISHKLQLAAAMKAEQALHDWSLTETAWAHPTGRHASPFRFRYDYQRADLDVRGPSFYDIDDLQRIAASSRRQLRFRLRCDGVVSRQKPRSLCDQGRGPRSSDGAVGRGRRSRGPLVVGA